MRPREQRTSLASARGSGWKCSPRSVPLRALLDTLAWTKSTSMPWSANSRWHQTRAKLPRLSVRRSMSISIAPESGASLKIIGSPVQVAIELARADEPAQLLQSGVGCGVEGLRRHADPVEQAVQLLGAARGIPAAAELRQMGADLVE